MRSALAVLVILALSIVAFIPTTYAAGISKQSARGQSSCSCLEWGIGYREYDNEDDHIEMSMDAESGISGVRLTKVYYEFRAHNDDTGYTRIYKGTDPAHNGNWFRAVSPRIGFGHITLRYRIKGFFDDGRSVWGNWHQLTDVR